MDFSWLLKIFSNDERNCTFLCANSYSDFIPKAVKVFGFPAVNKAIRVYPCSSTYLFKHACFIEEQLNVFMFTSTWITVSCFRQDTNNMRIGSNRKILCRKRRIAMLW